MLKRIVFFCVIVFAVYYFFLSSRIQSGLEQPNEVIDLTDEKDKKEETVRIYDFDFTKYDMEGHRELEIQGDSADMLAKIVELENVIAKAYAEDVPVTITADEGVFNKGNSVVQLRKNVVVTTDDGGRLLSEELDIDTEKDTAKTSLFAEVFQDDMHLEGVGAECFQQLKKVKFFKDIKVIFQKTEKDGTQNNIIITCDGPLHIDYERNTARFEQNVISQDAKGMMKSDQMDVYYDGETHEVQKIFASGDVVIEQENQNTTYSDSVVYLAQDGRIILDGSPEAFGIPSENTFNF